MRARGIDLGSRQVKLALTEDGRRWDMRVFPTFAFYRDYVVSGNDGLAVDWAGLGLAEEGPLVTTGYGRNSVRVSGSTTVTEVTAHALGTAHLTGLDDFTVLDIGGQDVKVIQVAGGRVVDFATNDRCAASSGRYLENMAALLGLSLEELSRHWKDPAELNSTCAVFGETEAIGKVSEGCSIESISAGVNYSVWRRVVPLLSPRLPGRLVMTGGAAQSPALQQIARTALGVTVEVPEHAVFAGAIGCSIQALTRSGREVSSV